MSRFRPDQNMSVLSYDAGSRESNTITMPAVGDATQGDYVTVYNAAGTSLSAFIDIDSDGTAPTGALYVASDEQATLAYKNAVQETYVLTFPATAAATQADYIMIYSLTGASTAVNLDIDADTTLPTGALYVGSDDQIEVDIITGGTAAQNATLAFTALDGNVTGVDFTDNLDGTLTVTVGPSGAAPSNPVTKNADDSTVGSIGVGTVTKGVLATLATMGADLLAAVSFTDVTFTAGTLGTVAVAISDIGNASDAVPKSANDSGAGSITVLAVDGSAKSGFENYPTPASSPTAYTLSPSTVS
jgi:hypothetical protein